MTDTNEELIARLTNMKDSLARHRQVIHAQIAADAIAKLTAQPAAEPVADIVQVVGTVSVPTVLTTTRAAAGADRTAGEPMQSTADTSILHSPHRLQSSAATVEVPELSPLRQAEDDLYNHERPYYSYCGKGSGSDPSERKSWVLKRAYLNALIIELTAAAAKGKP